MKTITADEFNAHFYEVLEDVKSGEKIEVTNGLQDQEVIGVLIPSPQKNKGT